LLYHHVANEEDLLGGMIDVVLGEVDLPVGREDWKTAMRQRGSPLAGSSPATAGR
jgi:hypothetical protein